MRKGKSKRQPSIRVTSRLDTPMVKAYARKLDDIRLHELSLIPQTDLPKGMEDCKVTKIRISKKTRKGYERLIAARLDTPFPIPESPAIALLKLGMSLEEQRVARCSRVVERYANKVIKDMGLEGKIVFKLTPLAIVPSVLNNAVKRRGISPEFL